MKKIIPRDPIVNTLVEKTFHLNRKYIFLPKTTQNPTLYNQTRLQEKKETIKDIIQYTAWFFGGYAYFAGAFCGFFKLLDPSLHALICAVKCITLGYFIGISASLLISIFIFSILRKQPRNVDLSC